MDEIDYKSSGIRIGESISINQPQVNMNLCHKKISFFDNPMVMVEPEINQSMQSIDNLF